MKNIHLVWDKQIRNFEDYVNNLKFSQAELDRVSAEVSKKDKVLEMKIKEVDAQKQRQTENESKYLKLIRSAEEKESSLASELKDMKFIRETLDKKTQDSQQEFDKLDKQREDLGESVRNMTKRKNLTYMRERRIKHDRLKLDELIIDLKLTKEFGEIDV